MRTNGSFDVVVVGAGAAGCVVAARLAEDTSRSVLLVEAGPDRRDQTPDGFRDGWGLPQGFDWGYVAEPRFGAEPQNVRRIKMIGGTGWLTRFAPRGAPADYDRWAALGNPGWDFDSVLPDLIRIENDLDFGDRPWHGDAGPIPVTRYLDLEHSEGLAAELAALAAMGFPIVDDHNEPGAVGAGRMPTSTRDGQRVTTADAYLSAERPNLVVRADTQVAEILFDGTRAVGVRETGGTVIHADWVVVSAGTHGSPLVLMRSGIGPSDHLQSVGIETRIDLPGVGANLADHSGVEFELGYRGPTRETPLLHVIATFHSSSVSAAEAPDLMLWMSDPVAGAADQPWLGVEVLLMRPEGRGAVRLRSPDPADPPRIELPELLDVDLERLVEGYELATELVNRPEVREVCSAAPAGMADDDSDVRTWIHQTIYSYPHVVGTCAMGSSPEDGAVVDQSGAVHGAQNLSVADASVMPDIPSGFTHFPTILIGERVAEAVAAAQASQQ